MTVPNPPSGTLPPGLLSWGSTVASEVNSKASQASVDELVAAEGWELADPLEWAAGTTYPARTVVEKDDVLYVSRSTTIGDDPASGGPWQAVPSNADVAARDRIARLRFDVIDYGVVGDGITDDTAAFQSAMTAAGVDGGRVLVPSGLTLRLTGQITHPSNVTLELAGTARLERDWTTTNFDKQVNATIRNVNAPAWSFYQTDTGEPVPPTFDEGCAIIGSGSIGLSAAAAATLGADTTRRACLLYYMACHRFRLEGVTIEGGGNDWAVCTHGDDAFMSAVKIVNGERIHEDGIHVMGGSRGTIVAPVIDCGDDALAFGGHYDLPIAEWVVLGASVKAHRGHALRVLRMREGSTLGFGPFTTHCRDIKVVGLHGSAGRLRNGCVRIFEDEASPGTLYRIDADVDLTANISGTHDNNNPQAIHLTRGQGRISGAIRNEVGSVLRIIGGDWDARIVAPDKPQTTNARTVDIEAASRVVLGGNVKAGAIAAAAVTITTSPFVRAVDLTVSDVLNGQAGIRCVTAGDVFEADGLTVVGAVGSTAARGITIDAASHLVLRNYVTRDVDRPLFTSTNAASIRVGAMLARVTRAIVSGQVTVQGEGSAPIMSRTPGSPDTLTNVFGGYVGQEMEIVNGEPVPGTATITLSLAGNMQLSAAHVLNTAGKGVKVRWNGAAWVQIAAWI
jgi:hypothetical protein